jgi:hypothetical protein
MLSAIGHFFAKIGQLVGKALKLAIEEGLNDGLIQKALELVKQAAFKFTDDTSKREWVVGLLMAEGVPQPIARIAVELAVKLFKKEVGDLLEGVAK